MTTATMTIIGIDDYLRARFVIARSDVASSFPG